jgi:hypothetical protein
VESVLAQQLPGWTERSSEVYAEVGAHPALAQEFAAKALQGDVSGAAATLANVHATLAVRDTTTPRLDVHGMKVLAQTASGAGGRPVAVSPDAAEWSAIKAAGPSQHWKGKA